MITTRRFLVFFTVCDELVRSSCVAGAQLRAVKTPEGKNRISTAHSLVAVVEAKKGEE